MHREHEEPREQQEALGPPGAFGALGALGCSKKQQDALGALGALGSPAAPGAAGCAWGTGRGLKAPPGGSRGEQPGTGGGTPSGDTGWAPPDPPCPRPGRTLLLRGRLEPGGGGTRGAPEMLPQRLPPGVPLLGSRSSAGTAGSKGGEEGMGPFRGLRPQKMPDRCRLSWEGGSQPAEVPPPRCRHRLELGKGKSIPGCTER